MGKPAFLPTLSCIAMRARVTIGAPSLFSSSSSPRPSRPKGREEGGHQAVSTRPDTPFPTTADVDPSSLLLFLTLPDSLQDVSISPKVARWSPHQQQEKVLPQVIASSSSSSSSTAMIKGKDPMAEFRELNNSSPLVFE